MGVPPLLPGWLRPVRAEGILLTFSITAWSLRVPSCPPTPCRSPPHHTLQSLPPEIDDPSSLDCMRLLTGAGNQNWAAYVDPAVNAPLPYGHLVTYPNWVDPSGAISELQDHPEFPDLGGRILGAKSAVLPPILTT